MTDQTTNQSLHALDTAMAVYTARPCAKHLLGLNIAAFPLLDGGGTAAPQAEWRPVEDPDAFVADFDGIRVVADRLLSADEARRLSGCLGYALRQTICGEDVSDPTITHLRGDDGTGTTVLEYGYNSTKSRRDDPDFDQTFSLATQYVREGSPIRRTDRAGWGTRGTRLVEGIGVGGVTFAVR